MVTNKRYAGFMPNDFIDGSDVSVSFWTQGCPFHCKGCHNPQEWDFDGGFEVPENIHERIKDAIFANGITRNFSVLGGEPLCDENLDLVYDIVKYVKELSSDIKIYLWTGYTLENLIERSEEKTIIKDIVNMLDVMIDGRFEEDKMSRTLYLRGSRNQRIINNPRI